MNPDSIEITCGTCGERHSFRRALLGRLVKCPACGGRVTVIDEPAEPVDQPIVTEIPVVTASVFLRPGQRMIETGPLLTAHRAIGTSVLTDVLVAIADFAGGRSQRVEDLMRQLHEGVVADLAHQAAALGYDAIVSLRVDFSELGKSVIYAAASGTPVKLADVSKPR